MIWYSVSKYFDGIGSTLHREGNTKGGYESGFWIPRLLSNCYHAMMLCDCCFILDWVCFPCWIFHRWESGKSHCNQERRKPQRLWRKWWSNSDLVVVRADLNYGKLLTWCFDQNVTHGALWSIFNSEQDAKVFDIFLLLPFAVLYFGFPGTL